jgi:alginate O-acetyltransferase complex protein AlgJ
LLAKIFIVFFFGFICFPWINKIIPIVKQALSSENRALAKFPMVDTCKLDKIPLYLENYMTDRLSTRNSWIRFYNRLNVFVFRSSPASLKAFVGKNNWLYSSGEDLKTFVGTELFKENELLEFKNEMLRREKIIGSYNAKLLIVIVPNKVNIYPEFMPDHIVKSARYGYGEQLLEYLKTNGLPVVDLYTELKQKKGNGDIYFKTDNHWNDLGAFNATNAILKHMQLELLDTIDYPVKRSKQKGGDIAKILNIENEIGDMNYSPTPKTGFKWALDTAKKYPVTKDFPFPKEFELHYHQNDTTLPDVLLIRDSFGKSLIPYLAERCHNCVAIWDKWQYGLNEAIIKDSKPDLVIYLINESQIKNLMHVRK